MVKQLDDRLLVKRSDSFISLDNQEKLLEKLVEGYRNSTERKKRNSYRFVVEGFGQLSDGILSPVKDYVAYGFYAAQLKGLAATDTKMIFVKDIELFRRKAEIKYVSIVPDSEFGNTIITETNDPGVWFNASYRAEDSVVDDIELFLEMTVDTPRGPKIAEQLKRRILQRMDVNGQKVN